MTARLARRDDTGPVGVLPDAVRVGKDVIELVTSGMYVFPLTIYREYIQNAVDAIDLARLQGLIENAERGRVSIDIDQTHRTLVIRDNGCGLPASEAADILLAIGGSPKRGTAARGFRGVGRLSGLAYCRQLEFRTKAAGDSRVLSVVWDCRVIRSRLADSHFGGDVREVIAEAASVWSTRATDSEDHFFEVRLQDVVRHRQDMLLNDKMISHYLAQVAPVPFANDFSHGVQIEQMLQEFAPRVPIDLTVCNEVIWRPYRDKLRLPGGPHWLQIDELEFVELADVDGEVGAVGWLGHHDYMRSIHPSVGVRGLRARIGDIQIGEPNLLDDCFREPRFNGWSVGEFHVLDERIVPNGRRDNFELNHHAYNLLIQIGPIAAQIAKRSRTASVARNSALIIRNIIAQVEQRLSDASPLARVEVSKFRAAIERCRKKLKGVGSIDADTLAVRLNKLADQMTAISPIEQPAVVALDEALALIAKFVTNREQARKLSDAIKEIRG
jgi:hypothetical protein